MIDTQKLDDLISQLSPYEREKHLHGLLGLDSRQTKDGEVTIFRNPDGTNCGYFKPSNNADYDTDNNVGDAEIDPEAEVGDN